MKARLLTLLACGLAALAPAFGQSAPAAAPAANVATGTTPLTREAFLTTLSRDLAAHFNLEGQLELDLLRPWSPPATVATQWNVVVTEYPTLAGSSMLVRCRILADGATVSEPTLVLRAELWRDAWATRSPLAGNTTFDPSLLEARRVDLFRDRDALPAAVGDRSYIFARGVPAGRLLTWRDISRRPLVKRGELVDVSAVEGLLTVTMKAVAMENGAQGDRVTVRNPDSRKDFSALVVDENRVEVRF